MKPISEEKYRKRRVKRGDKQEAKKLLETERRNYCQNVITNSELRKESAREYMKRFCKRSLVKEINNVPNYTEPREIIVRLQEYMVSYSIDITYYYGYTSKHIKKDLKNLGVECYMRHVMFKYSAEELATALKEVLEELYPYLKFKTNINSNLELITISYCLKA